jgi:hypothetical protein
MLTLTPDHKLVRRLFLSGDAAAKRKQMLAAAAALREGLRGAAVADVIMVDPEILFMNLDHGGWFWSGWVGGGTAPLAVLLCPASLF